MDLVVFLAGNQLNELKTHRRGWCGGGPKILIAIFTYNQRLLCIDMKTKVVQHVSRIIFNVFKVFKFSSCQVFKFSKFSGSQRLSDFQIFCFVRPGRPKSCFLPSHFFV